MRKTFVLAAILCGIFLLGICGDSFAASFKTEYKLSLNSNQNSELGLGAQMFADLVRERTDGKINIKPYWGGQLFSGKATNELLLMKKNIGDFSLSSFINWAPQFTEGNLFLLPWFITSYPDKYKAIDAVEHGKAGSMLAEQVLARFNLHILAWAESGARELTNNSKTITTPEDLKGLKIRVIGSPLFLDIFNALGGNPMNISMAEMLTALQQGTVDGQENPYSVIQARKIYEFQKYLTEWSYNMDPFFFTVHEKVWDSFPEDIRQIVLDSAKEAAAYSKALVRLSLDDGSAEAYLKSKGLYPEGKLEITHPREFLKKNGVEITLLTPEQIAVFKKKVETVFENWADKIGRDLVEAAKADMDAVQY